MNDETITPALDACLYQCVDAGAVLVTANQRLARGLRDHAAGLLQRDGRSVWPTPAILPWPAWLQLLYRDLLARGLETRRLLSDAQAAWHWRRLAEQEFAELIDLDALASSLHQAWVAREAHQPLQPIDDAYLGEDQLRFQQLAQRYRNRLLEADALDMALLPEVLMQHRQSLALPPMVFHAGFLQLTPQQQALLEAIDAQSDTRVAAVAVAVTEPVSAAVIGCEDEQHERSLLANWLRDQLEIGDGAEAPVVTPRIGVVVPDLHQQRDPLMRTLDAVFFPGVYPDQQLRDTRPYELSMGTPLSTWPLVRDALLLLQLRYADIAVTDLTDLLLSPYIRNAAAERRQRAKLDQRVRRDFHDRVDLAQLQPLSERLPTLTRLFKRWQKKRVPATSGCQQWARHFAATLEAAGWPGEGIDSASYQQLEAWRSLLAGFDALEPDVGKLTPDAALRLLRSQAQATLFQLQRDPAPVQILGNLESIGQTFDALWVMGMDSGQWPGVVRPNPWLPAAWQRLTGVARASAARVEADASTLFLAWSESATTVMFSYCDSRNGDEVVAAEIIKPLPALATLPECRPLMADVVAGANVEQLPDDYGVPVAAGSVVSGGAALFEDQAACPFRAFARHRLQLREPDTAVVGVDPRARGTLLHHALQLLWQQIQTRQALQALEQAERQQLLRACVQQALESFGSGDDGFMRIESDRLTALLGVWLEQHELPRADFPVAATERAVETEFGGLRLSFKIDRVDELDSGERLIVDYKTGTAAGPAGLRAERPLLPQLPLYAEVLEQEDDSPVAGVGFAVIAHRQQKLTGFGALSGVGEVKPPTARAFAGAAVAADVTEAVAGAAGEPDELWSLLRARWRQSLQQLATEYRSGLASVTPDKPSVCEYCRYNSLCRIDPTAHAAQEAESDAAAGTAGEAHG